MKTSARSLGIRICALVITLWLFFMGSLTWAVAQDFQNQISESAGRMVDSMSGRQYPSGSSGALPGRQSLRQISQLGDPYVWLRPERLLPFVLDQTPAVYDSDDWFWGDQELVYGFQPAMVFYDEAGNPLIKSGNLLSFNYISQEQWLNQNVEIHGAGFIDLDKLPQGAEFPRLELWSFSFGVSPSQAFPRVIRAEGYFLGDEFIPVSADVAEDLFLVPGEGAVETFCRQDHQGRSIWERALTLDVPTDVPLVTIYIRETGGFSYEHKPVQVNGKEYPSLVDYAMDLDATYKAGNLLDCYFLFTGAASESTGAARVRLAIHTRPLRYALLRMIPLYFWGSLVIGICLLLLLRFLRKNITRPLAGLSQSMDSGNPVVPESRLLDVRQAEQHLQQAQGKIRSLQNENQQLQASLTYAKHAEEKRRQLVSNITHELKTPLAVIHSYAEGLQAGIAGEKREYYLRTILEESKKMDAMVLEMLDLSRLEAGKVRLSEDRFSLLSLAKEIVDRLAPEETRTQDIRFRFCNECRITADEGRIGQVLTNLISNALRYTPQDGAIHLQVYSDQTGAHFCISNHADHLPKEVLEKIFDSFYQVDSSRGDKGSGLGLSIARSIIQLHRGTLTVRNIWIKESPGLEFAFDLPLN